jgi:TolB-like protein
VLVLAAGVALGTGGWRPFGPATGPPRLAVLLFENLSTEPDSDAFARGLNYELRDYLTRIQGIQLLSFASSSAFPSKERNFRRIKADLGADLVLAGSMFRADGAVKINVELVQVDDSVAIWTKLFDRKVSDVFAVQKEIAEAIIDELRLKMRWRKTYEPRPQFAELFARARGLESRRDERSALATAELYEQIVDGDPTFVPAWAGLANSLATVSRRNTVLDSNPRIEEAARKAFELDPTFERSQVARAIVLARDRNWSQAETMFLGAIHLNPSEPESLAAYLEHVLLPHGRFQDAVRLLTTALSMDPSSYVHRSLALNQADLGHYEAAIEHARWVIARDPDLAWTDTWLARALYLSGQLRESLEVFEKSPRPEKGYLGNLYARLGRRDDAEALAVGSFPAVQMFIYAGLGDKQRTVDAFERAVEINWIRALAHMHRPEVEPLIHRDPRVRAIEHKFGVPH